MLTYIVRRLLYAIPILIGVNVLTFFLFFVVNPPEKMARMILGDKNVTPEQVQHWLKDKNYHLPLFFNFSDRGVKKITQTIFYQKSVSLLWLEFGRSDRDNIDIGKTILARMRPSLMITVPLFLLSFLAYVTAAMLIAYCRGTYLDVWALIVCITLMSVSMLFYIIGGQWLIAKLLHVVPVSGYDVGVHALKFVTLPILIGLAAGAGESIRFYRIIFLEELGKDYIRTARAKGMGEEVVLFKHALKNAMIPILTIVVTAIPFLFTGSLLIEAFFAIPGLGSFTIEAIQGQDFAIVRSMVYLGSILYIAGFLLADISYTFVDPRVRLQ